MLYLKFYFFIRKAKWERHDSDTFFNKKKGITLTVYTRSDKKVINVKTSESSSLEYGGLAWWLTKRFFKDINIRIKKQEKKRDAQELKERNEQKLISALSRQCYVEIEFDSEERAEYKITKWLENKEYSYEKISDSYNHGAVATYYFKDKALATEFKMVWGGEGK